MKKIIIKNLFFIMIGICVWFTGVWIGDIALPIERGVYMLQFVLATGIFGLIGTLIPTVFKAEI